MHCKSERAVEAPGGVSGFVRPEQFHSAHRLLDPCDSRPGRAPGHDVAPVADHFPGGNQFLVGGEALLALPVLVFGTCGTRLLAFAGLYGFPAGDDCTPHRSPTADSGTRQAGYARPYRGQTLVHHLLLTTERACACSCRSPVPECSHPPRGRSPPRRDRPGSALSILTC